MLANNISRSSAILSKQRQALSFLYSSRALSSKTPDAAKSDEKTSKDSANTTTTTVNVPKRTAPRGLPTRHSRHHRPIVAPSDELDSSSQNILASIPGTLFSYNSKNLHQSKEEEYEQALHECHSLQQKVEFLLRGYSALLPGSMIDTMTASDSASANANGKEIIEKMIQLLERMELEGKTYVELRSKYRSQLARVSDAPNVDHDDDSKNDDNETTDSDTEAPDAWKMNSLITNYGAPPGPTIAMYDLILDTIAVSIPSSNNDDDALSLLQSSRKLHMRAIERFELDRKAGMEGLNESSCPTPATFNAVIRAAAIETEDERVRDTAIENGFYAFNTIFHHTVVPRNSSTYKYVLDMICAHFPPSEMRGNIVAGIWEKAVQDKVVDLNVYESMTKIGIEEHGELFDGWWKGVQAKFDKDFNGYGFPISWGKNKTRRRFDKRTDTY